MTKEKGIKFDLVFFKKNIALILFLVLLVFNIVATNNFLSWITFNNFFKQVSRVCLVSLGMSLVIATGGIDISVGSAMALGSVLAALGIVHQSPALIIFSILLVVAFGCLAGVAFEACDSAHGGYPGFALYHARYGKGNQRRGECYLYGPEPDKAFYAADIWTYSGSFLYRNHCSGSCIHPG